MVYLFFGVALVTDVTRKRKYTVRGYNLNVRHIPNLTAIKLRIYTFIFNSIYCRLG